jgi:type II restriction enzyme
MDLSLDADLARAYTSQSQRARVLTEHWLGNQGYCPNCGSRPLQKLPNNNPAADFKCADCSEIFELKSGSKAIGEKIVDGAYATMMARIRGGETPNLLLSRYDAKRLSIVDAVVVPRHFLTESAIEKRKPLSSHARRAGWVGCNILMRYLPATGRISIVKDGAACPQEAVRLAWRQCLFLRSEANVAARGWLIDVMACIDDIGRQEFTLSDVYAFDQRLERLYPANVNIRPKIRQQLQRLRDAGYLSFLGDGRYRRTS